MRALSQGEQRTIRLAVIGLALYLSLFYGARCLKALERRRAEYRQLIQQAETTRRELETYESKALRLDKLEGALKLDPAGLSRASLVAAASAAIQKAATSGGILLGPVREMPARPSAKELASMQVQAVAPVPAALLFLRQLETLGYPIILDSIQVTTDPAKPGTLKLSLTVVILDFDQWKKGTGRA